MDFLVTSASPMVEVTGGDMKDIPSGQIRKFTAKITIKAEPIEENTTGFFSFEEMFRVE